MSESVCDALIRILFYKQPKKRLVGGLVSQMLGQLREGRQLRSARIVQDWKSYHKVHRKHITRTTSITTLLKEHKSASPCFCPESQSNRSDHFPRNDVHAAAIIRMFV